jgi:hypothetical protein
MKKFALGTLALVMTLALFAAPAAAMSDNWIHKHNATGVSECEVTVVKKIPFDEYDMVIAAINPLTTIAGSGCTVHGGTTSFAAGSQAAWYQNGGVTLVPYAFKMNEVLAYWFIDSPNDLAPGSTDSGTSNYHFSWEKSSSGVTAWKLKVYVRSSDNYVELQTTSGASIYCGQSQGAATLPVSTSTTFYATYQIGSAAGVTPYIVVLGKR